MTNGSRLYDCTCVQEIEIALEVEYTGECEMAIDADLVSANSYTCESYDY